MSGSTTLFLAPSHNLLEQAPKRHPASVSRDTMSDVDAELSDVLLPVTLVDALAKIRELRASHAAAERAWEAEKDTLTDRMNAMQDEHIREQKRLRTAAKEREAVLLVDIDPQKVRESVVKDVQAETEHVVDMLRQELHAAEDALAAARAEVETLAAAASEQQAAARTDVEVRDAELELLRQTVLREAEEGGVLRGALEREREMLGAEREAWRASQLEAEEALEQYRQRAGKAELNARWVATVQQSLQTKDAAAKAATAATELLLEFLDAVRQSVGAIPCDAALNKALRTTPGVARAVAAGVDVAVLLGSGLSGFNETRAAANVNPGSAHSDGGRSVSRSCSPRHAEEAALPGTPAPVASPVLLQQELVHRARLAQHDVEAALELNAVEWSPAHERRSASPRVALGQASANIPTATAQKLKARRQQRLREQASAGGVPADLSQVLYPGLCTG